MTKPINPNLSIPASFANEGKKTDFADDKIQSGFNENTPDVLCGDNLNKLIDDIYKGLTYSTLGVSDLYKGAVLYDANENYTDKSIVFSIDDDGKTSIYKSLTNNNAGNSLSDTTKWQEISIGADNLNNPFSLFDCKFADHELNNISWLQSSGQWNDGNVYVDAYNELLTEYNNSESVEETEGSITFKRTPKGYKIALAAQDAAIAAKYTTDGIAWYYVLDTANTQFKLPRTKFGFEGLRDKVGDDIAESLPNIKGVAHGPSGTSATGAFTVSPSASLAGGSSSTLREGDLYFDASRSSSAYQDGAPVQERATQMYLYFYVGETVQNANLIDAGRIGERLAGKVDVSNVQWAINAYMPDYSAGVSIGLRFSSNPYTAPSAGIISVDNLGQNQSNTLTYLVINGITTNLGISSASGYTTTSSLIFPVNAGDVCYFSTSLPVNSVYFYPLKGAN